LADTGSPLLCLRFRWLSGDLLRRLAAEFARAAHQGCLLLAADDGSFVLADASQEPRARDLGAHLLPLLDARGGGQGAIFQGKAHALDRLEEATAALREVL
jgi:hypothetical protein